MFADVSKHCMSCLVSQVVGNPNQLIPPYPLQKVPIVGKAFSKVLIYVVGPLPNMRSGNQLLFTIVCLTTRFPEAIPLRKVTAAVIASALLKYFTYTGLRGEIQSDWGTNFMRKLIQQVRSMLDIRHIRSAAFHPESQGAMECFHQSMKNMLRCHCLDNGTDWDQSIPFVLFTARDAKQTSSGFTTFELVYGH